MMRPSVRGSIGNAPGYRIGYCTSGLQGLRLDDALRLLADLGYRGVFLTLDVHHLDPFAAGLAARVRETETLLRSLELAVVVETGARYLLAPRRKHWPVLLSSVGASRREEFLVQAFEIARDLGADCVSTWSGGNPDAKPETEAWRLLQDAFARLLEVADRVGVDLGFEPEPGMFIETVTGFHQLREAMGAPGRFKLSLDCGHLLVTGEGEPPAIIRANRDLLACVAIEDMVRGIHEHRPFGEGDIDLPPLLAALSEVAFEGVVAVELGRHSHEGPHQALKSRDVLCSLGVPFGRGN